MTTQESRYYDSAAARRTISSEIHDLYQNRALIWQLTIRNLTVRYKRSFLGILWTMLDPLMTMLIMTFVFSSLLQRAIHNFPVYLLTALTVWGFFSQATISSMRDFLSGERILSKVHLPQSIFVIVAINTALVNFFISLVTVFAIAFFSKMPISLPLWLTLIVPIIILIMFNLGIGLLLAPSVVYFNDLENIYGISLRLLLYLSAIFYQLKDLPVWLQHIINLNPVYHFIAMFRAPIYYHQLIPLPSLLYTGILSIVLFGAGLVYFTRLSDDIATKLN